MLHLIALFVDRQHRSVSFVQLVFQLAYHHLQVSRFLVMRHPIFLGFRTLIRQHFHLLEELAFCGFECLTSLTQLDVLTEDQ